MKHMKESREKAALLFKTDKYVDAKSIYLELIATVESGDLKNVSVIKKRDSYMSNFTTMK